MRTKTIRAIEPNAGTKAKLEKKLASYFEAVTKEASRAVFEALINEGVLVEAPQEVAQDADAFALTLNAYDLYMGRPFKLIKGIAPARVEQIVSDVFRKIYAHFLINRGDDAKEVSSWFVRSAARSVTSSQRKALTDAGISPQAIRKKWTVPVIKGQYLSREAAEALPTIVDEMTGLITRMASEDLERVRTVITQGVTGGMNLSEIEKTLKASKGFTAARAKRVALDQSIKVNQAIQRANDKSLGLTEGIWVHVPGRYSSRHTHVAMNGKRFKLDEGLYDKAVDRNVLPGSEPYCRCIYRAVLPPELLE